MLSMLGIETNGRKSHNPTIYGVLGTPDFELLLLNLTCTFLSQRKASALKAEKFQPRRLIRAKSGAEGLGTTWSL